MASKTENKKCIMDPYDGNDSISFDISKYRWLLGGKAPLTPHPPPPPDPFFHIYTFWNYKIWIYNFPRLQAYTFSNKPAFVYFFRQY